MSDVSVKVDARRQLLRAALGFLSLEPREPELRLLNNCFDTWRGIGDIVAGMARQEYDLELRRYNGRGWRAIFFLGGFEHSLTSHAGGTWTRSPWETVQRAASNALHKLQAVEPAPLSCAETVHLSDSRAPIATQPLRCWPRNRPSSSMNA